MSLGRDALTVSPDWRDRLLDAVDADPRSDRAISMAAGLGPNFVNELRNTDKEPGIKKVLKLAGELGVSLSKLFLGGDLTPEDEEYFAELLKLTPDQRRAILVGLKVRRSAGD